MANVLKYKTSQPTKQALRKGNTVLGIGDENYGPSSTTGYYSGVDVPEGGYVVYTIGLNNNPKVFVAQDEDDLPAIARTLGGGVLSVADSKTYLAGLNNTWILDNMPNNIVTDGLVLDLNVTNPSSFPESGSTIYDISGNGDTITLYNGSIVKENRYIEFDGSDDRAYSSNDYTYGNETTWIATVKRDTNNNNYNMFMGDYLPYFGFRASTNYKFHFSNQISGIQRHVYSATQTSTGTWYHVVFTTSYNGSQTTMKVYVNGNNDGTSTHSGNQTQQPGQPKKFTIGDGRSNATWYPLDGKVSNVKIYDKELSQSEILQNYYGGPIVTDGLIFALDAGNLVSYESGSTTTYSMTGSYSASLDNGVGFRQDNGGVFYFDGSDDIITGPNINPSSITVEVWKKWTTVSDDWLITNQVAPTDSSKGYYIRIDNPSYAMRFYAGTGGSAKVVATTIELNKWYHVVGNIDANSTNLYVNGELVSTTSGGTIDYTGVQGLTIGAANDNSRDTPGPVGPIRIYDRALSSDEVFQNYNAQKTRFGL